MQQFANAPFPLPLGMAEEASEEVDILEDGERGVEIAAEALGHVGDLREDAVAVGRVGDVAAEHVDPPLLDGAGPATSDSRVDLPTPSGPMMPVIRPASTSRSMPSSAFDRDRPRPRE